MRKKEHILNYSGLARAVSLEARDYKTHTAPTFPSHNPAGASTAPGVMKHIACGAGAATERSSKGGKGGGGMGGQQAGGVKGGGKRKTHAGRK
jgi:hypothetical protein